MPDPLFALIATSMVGSVLGKKNSGMGLVSSPCRRMSPTTPTTVIQASFLSGPPSLKRLPTGFSAGKNRRAKDSFTMAICAFCSWEVKNRPLRTERPWRGRTPASRPRC